jgi:hypothetical protein
MPIIANPPKGGIVLSKGARDEYLFYWWLYRLYNRWREPHIFSMVNIVLTAMFNASGGHRHGLNHMSTCANHSLVMRDYPMLPEFAGYIPLGQESSGDE